MCVRERERERESSTLRHNIETDIKQQDTRPINVFPQNKTIQQQQQQKRDNPTRQKICFGNENREQDKKAPN